MSDVSSQTYIISAANKHVFLALVPKLILALLLTHIYHYYIIILALNLIYISYYMVVNGISSKANLYMYGISS